MTLDEFLRRIEEEFEELSPNQINADDDYDHFIEWSSMNSLMLMGLIKAEFGVLVTVTELKSCKNFRGLYEIATAKMKQS